MAVPFAERTLSSMGAIARPRLGIGPESSATCTLAR